MFKECVINGWTNDVRLGMFGVIGLFELGYGNGLKEGLRIFIYVRFLY